jgi:mannose-1-phosphate guanylyltransferase
MKAKRYSIVLAGGKGTRFWPLSRSQRPKQLLKILGRKSLISETVSRVLPLSERERTLVVTVAQQLNASRRELRALPPRNFIVEPEGKNTAPCIGLAALEVINRDPEGAMIVLPADHWVADVAAFRRTLKVAVALASRYDRLVTIGIRPNYPETGYGYILRGKPLEGKASGVYQVKRFREKPSASIARRLIRQGSLWNSGIFVWKAATLLRLLRRYQPAIAARLEIIGKAATGATLGLATPRLRRIITREYKRMPALSIDYAVLENAGSEGEVLTLEADFGWSDVGSWAAVHRMLPLDQNGNGGNGKWLARGANHCLVHANDRLVVLLGVRDTMVVDTPDALLVGDLKRSQEVRELVEELKKKGYGAYTIK